MELNELEKRQLFQVEGDCQTKVLNELYLTARYTTDPKQREAAQSLADKLRSMSANECMDLVKDSKRFRTEHETDILLHQAAKKYFDSLAITKLPSVKNLREEYAGLLEQKRKAYAEYKQVRMEMKELHNVRANVEYLLDIPIGQETSRKEEKNRQ